jgi:hypothetical protein
MPPKVTLTTVTTLGLVSDTNIANTDSQIVIIGQLQAVVNQFINNSIALNDKINNIGILKVKMPLIERFSKEKVKLKRFLT